MAHKKSYINFIGENAMFLKIEDMTTRQKLGMVFCARNLEGENLDYILEMIKNRELGCIQLQAHRPDITEKVLAAADYPILVFNDAEMGFPTSDLPKIPLMSLSACDNEEYLRAFAKGISRDAKKAGFNGNWGPVIDILRTDGPCRVHRRLSDDPGKVARSAEVICEVFRQNHHLSTGKHYPGGHDSMFDTHMAEGISDVTEEELLSFDLVPYKHLMEKGLLPCIMTDHSVYRNIDPKYPASLSKKVISIIRNLGYDGVIFTDSFAMMGILQKFGEENIYGMAIDAGNDIILPNYRTPVRDAFEMLCKNFEDGAFTEEQLDNAVRRVLRAQEFVGTESENPTEFTEKDEETLRAVARDCITAVCDDGVSPALDGKNEDKLFIVMKATDNRPGWSGEIEVESWYRHRAIAEKIKSEFPGSGIEFIPEFSGKDDHERVLNEATKYSEVIFITYCDTTSYLGTDALTRRSESVLNSLIHSGKMSAVVHFGNPFALKNLLHTKRIIFGYLIPDSQLHAIDVLAGKLEAKGKLPFDDIELN